MATDADFCLVFALRYALGRESAAPSIVHDEILRRLSELPAGVRETMVRDIDDWLREDHPPGCDWGVDRWKNLCCLLSGVDDPGCYPRAEALGSESGRSCSVSRDPGDYLKWGLEDSWLEIKRRISCYKAEGRVWGKVWHKVWRDLWGQIKEEVRSEL